MRGQGSRRFSYLREFEKRSLCLCLIFYKYLFLNINSENRSKKGIPCLQ